MEHSTKENGIFIVIKDMEEDTKYGQMEVSMKDIGKSTKPMVEVV